MFIYFYMSVIGVPVASFIFEFYVALRLMQAVTARVNDVCLRYLDNSRLDSLPPPPASHLQELRTVSAATKNSRRVMEDRHVEIGNLEALFGIECTKPTAFYAVYDGHAGSAAATYCAAHLHQYLVESPHYATDLRKALRDAFLRTDNDFIRKSNQERACGGSTAVVVAVRGCQLHAAWAGDSLALLAKRMRLMQLVRPHKPSRQDEKDRIQAGGGAVMFWGTWRVNGQLAVSRAIGDAMYKPYVTARPELATVDLDGDEDFVVVACDGLWDFVSEDEVALAVYRQLAADPDDLKAVTKRLIVQAKRQGSCDNISIIVVFLKDPRDIAADNRPPMDLGLDNALVNASLPPFAVDADAKHHGMDGAAAECGEPEGELADNGVDNSDSDSEDLGPETAVDADDLDAEARNHVAPPTPPAHTVEASHIDGALADNVGESGEESEDEWNYFKGEGERSEQQRSEPDGDEQDEPPRSETPCQDNSAWESSSVDMNSSPLNPDAPVFVPGTVAGADILLAESPRKPQPMDDIELPDVQQFETEVVQRPAELLDLDNCDQLNGHHNVSIDGITEQLNGNEKNTLDSLGFGFSVGMEPDKAKDISLIQDFDRIQKDTTDFCNIQVFQAHSETNPFASDDNEELLERLKSKERDPMSMSFYQEKDDDTCERLLDGSVDLNAVQPLPDADDDDNDHHDNKENVRPFPDNDHPLPNNDQFDQGANFMDYVNNSNNLQNFPNIDLQIDHPPQDNVMQTDTPESHKLLFEQIPEIPDGKSSELGFNEDIQDLSDRAITPQEETSQDVEMECKLETPCEPASRPESAQEPPQTQNVIVEAEHAPFEEFSHRPEHTDNLLENDVHESHPIENHEHSNEHLSPSPAPADRGDVTPEPAYELQENVKAEIHNYDRIDDHFDAVAPPEDMIEPQDAETPHDLHEDVDLLSANAHESETTASPLPSEAPLSPAPHHDELLAASPLPAPHHEQLLAASPAPAETDLISNLAAESPAPSPLPTEVARSPLPTEIVRSPLPTEDVRSPFPTEDSRSPLPTEDARSPLLTEDSRSPLPTEDARSPLPTEDSRSPLPTNDARSPLPAEVPLPSEPSLPSESPLPAASPLPVESTLPVESEIPRESPLPVEIEPPSESPAPEAAGPAESPLPAEPELRPETASPMAAAPSPAPPVCDRLTPELPREETAATPLEDRTRTPEAASGPAPDIVPEERTEQSHRDLITDIDIGIPESHAQEICVPVTSEIIDEAVQLPAGTPPPTPAVDLVAPPLEAPVAGPADAPLAAAAAAAAVGAAAATAVAATAAAAAKAKTPAKKTAASLAPKTTATPKSATKAAAPSSAGKKPATAPAARPAASRPSLTKSPAAPAAAKSKATTTSTAAKPSSRPAVKSSSLPAKEPPAAAKPTAPRAALVPRSAPKAPAAAAPRPAAPRAAPAARPATAPAARAPPKPAAPAPRPAARPAPRPAPAPAKPKEVKPAEKKPLTNGDAKAPAPIKRVPIAARPAPRPATAPATAPPAPKAAAPRARALDKQSKDLANKRITAKAAPPRTAPAKTAPASKTSAVKSVPKKPLSKASNGLVNGAGAGAGAELKPPPSPPAADNALLPDVIA
ncbi:microtubule-associated protein 1A-like isoform X2 [Cydia pomonella]|uniref:microtubule-associated protein 1A-like isoform X2 n=1 Tax=Cydia pomonella TaxID=82600 RepID=UPI002ADE6AAD|nr:microtubule-associated protein 1A-like isoform X2 [Cydia pomonella]